MLTCTEKQRREWDALEAESLASLLESKVFPKDKLKEKPLKLSEALVRRFIFSGTVH